MVGTELKNQVKYLLKKGDVKRAIELLSKYYPTQLIVLSSRVYKNDSDFHEGFLTHEEYMVNRNRLTQSILFKLENIEIHIKYPKNKKANFYKYLSLMMMPFLDWAKLWALTVSFSVNISVIFISLLPLLEFPVLPIGQEGISVNLGVQAVGKEVDNTPPAKTEPKETPSPPPKQESIPNKAEEETPSKDVITDDNSKEIALKKEKERKKKEEELQKRKKEEADIKKRIEEEARRKKAQEEARRKAQAEAKRKEEAAVADELGSLFGGGNESKGSKGLSGNQGNPTGDPNSDILKGVSAGAGNSVGGGLRGRGLLNTPKINDDFNMPGKIVIKVCVDASGKVISADFTHVGSTTSNSQLVG